MHVTRRRERDVGRWWFLRHGERVTVIRQHRLRMVVSGGGTPRAEFTFDRERDVERFQMALADRLTRTGWLLVPARVRGRRLSSGRVTVG
jgi:hypothetical protein